MSIIYMGSMDDRVWKYPWKQSDSTVNNYLKSIIQNIIIGKKSAINDGYILNNHLVRDSIFKDKKSLLRDIMSTGEIIIPGRKGSFEELIDEQVDEGVFTFSEIPKEVKARLATIDKDLNKAGARIEGPESMTVWNGFFDLMQSLRDRPFEKLGLSDKYVGDYDFKMALDMYLDIETNGKPPSRTEWEEVLEKLCKKSPNNGGLSYRDLTKRALMNLANEAYHYNFSNVLSNKIGKAVGVETSFTPAFSHMLDNGEFDLDGINYELPLIEIPNFHNLMSMESIEKLLSSDDIGQVRLAFISALDKLNDGTVEQKNIDELKHVAKDYNLWIKDEFGNDTKKEAIDNGANFILSTLINYNLPGLNAMLSWIIPKVGGGCITQMFTDDSYEIDYIKNTMVSSRLVTKPGTNPI